MTIASIFIEKTISMCTSIHSSLVMHIPRRNRNMKSDIQNRNENRQTAKNKIIINTGGIT